MSTRTTVTLEEDVLQRLRDESRMRGASFRDTLNELLRFALSARGEQHDRSSFRVRASPLGLRPGLSYDDVETLLDVGEGGGHR